nr:hypothetical protein [Flavobacterium sp. ASV13]
MADIPIDLAKNVIVNYKDITSWILLGIILILTCINYFKELKLSKTVESFKADLTKKEIKFTRHTELQIECLKKLYDLVVSFHFSFLNFSEPPYKTHEWMLKNIRTLKTNFDSTLIFFHRNKILLTDEIIAQIGIIHEKFKRIEVLCRTETDNLYEAEEYYGSSDSQILYTTPENEVDYIKGRIETLNKNSDIQTFEADIKKLRAEIENYFRTLVN